MANILCSSRSDEKGKSKKISSHRLVGWVEERLDVQLWRLTRERGGSRNERGEGEVMDTSGKRPTGLVLSYRADGNFSRSDQNQRTSQLVFFFESSVFNVTYI